MFGAYGHTGRFVVAQLRRRGWTPVLSGRDPERLKAAAQEHSSAEGRVAATGEAFDARDFLGSLQSAGVSMDYRVDHTS